MALKNFSASCEYCGKSIFNGHLLVVSNNDQYMYCDGNCLFLWLKDFREQAKNTPKKKVCKLPRQKKPACAECEED